MKNLKFLDRRCTPEKWKMAKIILEIILVEIVGNNETLTKMSKNCFVCFAGVIMREKTVTL